MATGLPSTYTTEDFECPDNTLGAVTPDPDDCRSYYDCPVDQAPHHLTCTKGPPATLFDDKLLICNYEDQVDCGDRPIIDGPTTTTIGTTTTATVTTTSGNYTHLCKMRTLHTACRHRMAHRKWEETKQQPSLLPGPAVPGSCLVSFHILWA